MNRSAPAPSVPSASRWMAFMFALGVLVVGFIPAVLTFLLDPNAATRISLDAVPIPAWVFTAVWLVIYPSMGIATWLVWQQRHEQDSSVPIAVFAAALLQTVFFWLTNSVRMTAVMDLTGVLFACTTAWVYSRYRKVAVWWLVPWLLWMPITFAVKLWALSQGVQ